MGKQFVVVATARRGAIRERLSREDQAAVFWSEMEERARELRAEFETTGARDQGPGTRKPVRSARAFAAQLRREAREARIDRMMELAAKAKRA